MAIVVLLIVAALRLVFGAKLPQEQPPTVDESSCNASWQPHPWLSAICALVF